MALTVTFEWWSAEDAYAAADILQDWTSGSIGSLVTGLRGQGNAISLPVNLIRSQAKEGVAGGTTIITHFRARYDQDDVFLKTNTSSNTGPSFTMAAGTITVKRSDGTTISSIATGWAIGEKHTLSTRVTLSTAATGTVEIWLDSTRILNSTGVQTVPAAGSVSADRMEINGFGVFDDIGFRTGSAGAVVNGDIPTQKWVRLQMASADGTLQQFAPFGSGATHVARVSEHPPDTSNGVQYEVNDGSVERFFVGTVPADVTAIWGVQYAVQAFQQSAVARSIRIQVRQGATSRATTGTISLTQSAADYGKFLKQDPNGSVDWTSSAYANTQIELLVTV